MPGVDAASIAWIGSIQLFFTTVGCLPAGILLDRGYLKSLIAAGTILEVAGLIVTSFSRASGLFCSLRESAWALAADC